MRTMVSDVVFPAFAFFIGLLVALPATWLWLRRRVSQCELLIAGLESEKKHLEANLCEQQALQERFQQSRIEQSVLTTRLEQQRIGYEDKLTLLNDAKENLRKEFENLAHRIFDDKQEKFQKQSHERLDSVINPLREQLTNFHKKVEDVYDKESKERSSLIGEIRILKELNQQISQDAINLTHALKGDNKAQGNWGEMVLESILERSGLVKGREYETQVSLKNEEGSRRAPDVIVRLPEGKDIIIDSKMVLVDYDRYYSAKTEEERQIAIKAHTQAIKNHINGLNAKSYENLEGVRSLDFVLLFIPIEAAFMIAVENDPEIFRNAFDKGIIVVSPTTLLATLRTVQSIWRHEKQNKNAELIASEAGKLHDQFVQLLESLEEVGRHIDKAHESYDVTVKRLATGRGNLVSKVANLEKLGAKTKKQIPSDMKETNDDFTDNLLPHDE